MGTPGSGRYTDYVPYRSIESTQKWSRLKSLFNDKAAGGDFYSSNPNLGAAELQLGTADAARKIAKKYMNDYDLGLWSANPRAALPPDLNEVKRSAAPAEAKAGFPANPYMPDLRSPGSSGEIGGDNWSLRENDNSDFFAATYKPNISIGSGGTANPSANVIAEALIGTDLKFGKSNKKI